MKIFISGATGLIGATLSADLAAAGHDVYRLVRKRADAVGGNVYWNPAAGELDASALAGADAIVNLAGESIAAGRWNEARKRAIHDSRTAATRTIAAVLAQPNGHPQVLINASATGYYGDRGDEWLDETSAAGSGDFLSGVCRDWEAAAEPARRAGARVVFTRFGVVLSGAGGALRQMLLPFRLGVGGVIGSGRQYLSWVSLDDVVDAIIECLSNDSLSGPVNVVAPNPVTNREFTKTLGRVLRRPTILPMPAFAARLALGQMADELLLASQRVRPAKLLAAGYDFKFPTLEAALTRALYPWAHGAG
ncbi:MAG: TIGR01777 family oxidoreductase [Pirellulales bacterium]